MLGLVLLLTRVVVGSIPFGDLPLLGVPLAWLAGSVLGIRRGHIELGLGRAGLPVAADAVYESLGTGVMELFWLAARPRDLSSVAAFAEGAEEKLLGALGEGKGVVLAASHTGNWELSACALAQRIPLSVLVKRVRIGAFERLLFAMRRAYGVGLLEGAGALDQARRELESGRAVAVLLDQVPPREEHGEWLPFLGEDALTDRAGAALAATTGSPLVVTAQRRGEDGRHVLHVLSVKHPPLRGRRAWAARATREATLELAAFVRDYPDQWLWLHRRWKKPGAPPISRRSGGTAGSRASPRA